MSTVRLLLEFKANVNVQDAQLKTPILWSIQMGNISLVDLLLKHNADLDLKDAGGMYFFSYYVIEIVLIRDNV